MEAIPPCSVQLSGSNIEKAAHARKDPVPLCRVPYRNIFTTAHRKQEYTMEMMRLELDKGFFIKWYETSGRTFPWRQKGTSAFSILVTEMLLRQTDAPSVAKLWTGFFARYPDAATLARADKEELFSYLKILGLADQRSSALLLAASWIVEYHKGVLPDTKEELCAIPHVGLYVAHAVLCFAFERPVEIVDTNILRFFSRYYDIFIRKPDIRRNPKIWEIAHASLPSENVKQHNYGLLDFTAEICKNRNPLCSRCPLASSCRYALKNRGCSSPS
jgi:A/G-specific adenine glycosylase